jgi:hypothetical protein
MYHGGRPICPEQLVNAQKGKLSSIPALAEQARISKMTKLTKNHQSISDVQELCVRVEASHEANQICLPIVHPS